MIRRLTAVLLLAATAGLATNAPAIGQDTAAPISVDDWIARLETARGLAEQGAADPSQAAMDEVRAALGFPVSVATPSGTVLITSDPAMNGYRGGAAADFFDAAAHLEQLENAARDAQALAPVDRDQVRSNVQRAYRGVDARRNLTTEAIYDLRVAAGRLLDRILETLFSNQGPMSILGWTIVALAAVALFFLIRRARAAIVPHRKAGEDGEPIVVIDWMRRANEALARGDAREAVRCFYHAMLEDFASDGIVTGDPSLTSGELRSAVGRAKPDLYTEVARATSTFERSQYGEAVPTDDEVEALRRMKGRGRP